MAEAASKDIWFPAPRDALGQGRMIAGVPVGREKAITDLRERVGSIAVGHMPQRAVIGSWFEIGRVDRIGPRRRTLLAAGGCNARHAERKSDREKTKRAIPRRLAMHLVHVDPPEARLRRARYCERSTIRRKNIG
jgi:hypothetical protein